MSASTKPRPAREPHCIHSGQHKQPASACRICKDSPELRKWVEEWGAWLTENPDSYEARWVAEHEAQQYREDLGADYSEAG